MERKTKKKRIMSISLFVVVYLILASILGVGIWYASANIEQFNMYRTLVDAWNKYSGANSPNFDAYLNDYNNLATSNEGWVQADQSLFILGISLIAITLILAGATIYGQILVNKKINSKNT